MSKWFRPSGGLRYHLRALRRRPSWQPFCDALEAWLRRWPIPHDELVLIGPSGGYTLPRRWLRSFNKIFAYDLDPLAKTLCTWRHGPIAFTQTDIFFANHKLSREPMKGLLERHPHASVLFCNVLGQVPLEGDVNEVEWQTYLLELRKLLTGRRWASFHDLYTVEPLAHNSHDQVVANFSRDQNIQLAVRSTNPAPTKALSVTDHGLLSPWSAGLEKEFFAWPLTPNSLHLIEGLTSV